MALKKIKQIAEDPILIAAPRAEHGIPKFAHLNQVVDYVNTLEETLSVGTGTTNNVTKFTAPNVIGDSILVDNGTSVTNSGAGNIPSNTAFGKDALISNTTGVNNTAFGENALTANTTGVNNTVFGSNNLLVNTTGSLNTVVGLFCLQANTTGSNNNAFGDGALYSNVNGTHNTAIGVYNLFNNINGVGNTAVGHGVMTNNTSGFYNTALGRYALKSNTTASHNVAVGFRACEDNTTGANNSAIGHDCQTGNFSGSVILGRLATATANNQFVVGSASTNAGTVVTETNASTKVWNVKINGVDYKILLA